MKKIALFLGFCIAAIFLIYIISAEVFETNLFKYGTIDSSENLDKTKTPITDVSVIGFVCAAKNCAAVSEKLWNGTVLNSEDDTILLTYPETLLSKYGYGVYMFKEDYIPYEVNPTLAGNGPAGPYTNYLSKKETCKAELNNFNVRADNQIITVAVNASSPIKRAGPLDYIPESIKQHYAAEVQVKAEAISSVASQKETKILSIPYSGKEQAAFSFSVQPGSYIIKVSSAAIDRKCLSSSNITLQKEVVVNAPTPNVTDTTSPAAVKDLRASFIDMNTIRWEWTNPPDSDFKDAIIYFDNKQPVYTSQSVYEATGLLPNTLHTLRINTRDLSGNINYTNVTDTQRTLSLTPNNETNISDKIPPSTITNLKAIAIGKDFITWSWTNPPDSDFKDSLLYLNNLFVGAVSNRIYNATFLAPNATYTLRINTRDLSGNINYTNITDTETTLTGVTPQTNITNETIPAKQPTSFKSSRARTTLNFTYEELPSQTVNPLFLLEEDKDAPLILFSNASKAKSSSLAFILLVLDIALLLFALVIALISATSPRSQRRNISDAQPAKSNSISPKNSKQPKRHLSSS